MREGANRTGEDVRRVFEAILPQPELDRRCVPCGVIERQRKRHWGMLVRAMVIAAGTPGGASQADVRRSSLACGVPSVARSALYRCFDEPLAQFMAILADRALASARGQQVALPGILDGVKDWDLVDSTTTSVRDALRDECPGAGEYAALKGHKVFSVGCGAPVRYHCSPAREHDRRHLQIDASWQGCGLLADLASASVARLRACHAHEVRCVLRLKDNWKPKVDSLARGHLTQEFCPGPDLEGLLDQDILVLDGHTIDADVRVGKAKQPLPLRLVGGHTATGDGFFLTNLPPRRGPRQVAASSRVRWEVELSLNRDKSVHRLDQVDAERPCSVTTLLHASLIASILAARLAHTHTRQSRPALPGEPRTEAPRHPRRLALPLAVSCQSMAQAFELKGASAKRRWQALADLLRHRGKDPNWRRRPSVVDQLRGWKRQPVARKPSSHRHLKSAASVDTYGRGPICTS
jgi:Transposase DDE domain